MSEVRSGPAAAGAYAIRVQGRLEQRWAGWFEGCTLTPDGDGTTVITGTVADQAALHGLLQVLRDLGLPLVSVTPVPTSASGPSPQPPRRPTSVLRRRSTP